MNKITTKEYFKERLKNIPMTIIMGLFVAFCLGTIVYFAVIGRSRDIVISLTYLAIVPLFYFLERIFGVRAPLPYTIFVMTFVLFCFLGASFNFYTIIKHLDDILHACWGLVFATVGIIIIKSCLGTPKGVKGVVAYVMFGIGFAMLMSIIWEIFEFCGDNILGEMDMQQDAIVDHIHSFKLYPSPDAPAPDNLHTWNIEGIDRTELYDSEGNLLGVINGGYLDIGLIDTMMDLIFCITFLMAFSLALGIDWCHKKFIYRWFIPALVGEFDEKEEDGLTAAEQPSTEDTPQ